MAAPSTTAQNAFTLKGAQAISGLMPPEQAGEVFKQIRQDSVIAPLVGTVPMNINGTEFFIRTQLPEADIVEEAQAKPISKLGLSTRKVTPVKAATIVYWSREARLANPAGVLDQIQQDMSDAIRRQIDYAILYGKSAKSDATIPGVEYINQTTTRVELGTATQKQGGLSTDLITGYDKVVNSDAGYDFTGFVADPLLRTQLLSAVDLNGRPIYQNTVPDLSANMGNLLGLPVSYGRVVSGRVAGHADTKVRAFGGDFKGNVKLGIVENISVSVSNEATIVDGSETIGLWQHNLEAALVECTFGWIINNKAAFVAYEDKTPNAEKAA